MATALPLAQIELDEGDFHRRRQGARQSGNPAWLWPEVPVAGWIEATEQIAAAISRILRGDAAHLANCDPQALCLTGYTSGTGPLLGWWMEAGHLTAAPELAAVLALHLSHGRERLAATVSQARSTLALLARRSISAVVLKGGHTAFEYFPHPATRPASDFDLLVPASRAQTAESALVAAGFECVGRGSLESSWMIAGEPREPRSVWVCHAEDPWSIDLHTSLDSVASAGASVVRLDLGDPFDSKRRSPLGQTAKVLRQPLQILHLAVHAGGGLHSLTLLRMVEIILVVRRDVAAGKLSWSEFLRVGELTSGLGSAYPAFAMCERLAPGTIPEEVLRRCRESAPNRVRTIVDRLEPARAQRVDRTSIAEHFMWVSGLSGWARQLGSDLVPRRSITTIYETRAYRLLRGTITR